MSSPLPKAQLTRLRRTLLEEQERLVGERERLMAEVQAATVDTEEHPGYGNHAADDASDLFEGEKNLTIYETLGGTLDQVGRALRRMDEGTYGLCENCGQPINPERLEALPSATLCIDCARKVQRER